MAVWASAAGSRAARRRRSPDPEFRRTPHGQAQRVREQVEWAAQHGMLREAFSFFTSLPEADWVHMGD